MRNIPAAKLCGVWSATPTPFDEQGRVDTASVERLIEHHLRLGVRGLFLAGTCGEGAWMPDAERRRLVQSAVAASRGRLAISVQVTDNSAARILDNMRGAEADGADMAVIAPPYFLLNATPDNLRRLYREAIQKSPLPVGLYDRGKMGAVVIPDEVMADLYAEPNVVAVKDSSVDPARRAIALEARRQRPELRLFDGDEFHCVEYLQAGYDGLMLGGGILHGFVANRMVEAVAAGDIERAHECQRHMTRLMNAVYGENIECWLTGLKQFLVEIGVFESRFNYLHFPLTDGCRAAIAQIIETDRDVLPPPASA
jgi:4-hydroxy-tetrahydrodipicolinate synthase